MTESTNTLVVGAGPAGLASGASLVRRGVDAVLVEQGETVGPAWHHHYERLHLHTAKSASGLPGMPMPRSYPRYPSRDQVADYLREYATAHDLDVRLSTVAASISRSNSHWVTTTGGGERFESENVVVAIGRSSRPFVPDYPGMGGYTGTVMHSSEYVNGKPFVGKDVLVVGFGNSSGEIALDLMEHGARPRLSVRSKSVVVPRDIFGIPIQTVARWLSVFPPRVADALSKPLLALLVGDISKVGIPRAEWGPLEQIATKGKIPLLDIGTMKALKEGSIEARPGIERFTPDGVVFTDGRQERCEAVVLGTGYIHGIAGLLDDVPGVLDEEGVPLVSGAATAEPGLYFCGFNEPPSGLLREIGIEAERIGDLIAGVG